MEETKIQETCARHWLWELIQLWLEDLQQDVNKALPGVAFNKDGRFVKMYRGMAGRNYLNNLSWSKYS